MSDKNKGLLDRIKALMFDNALPTAYKLADGTDVTISLLDVGGDFAIGGQPAPEGSYTLEDGSNVTVDATGKITQIEAPADMSATEYTLADGTKITIDKMEVGGAVMQGEQPIANGDYTLEDGSKISVAGGLITVIEPKTELAAETPAPAVTDEHINALIDAKVAGYKDGLKNQFEAKFTAQEDIIKKQGDTINQMLELMTQLAEAPAGDPPTKKVTFTTEASKGKKDAVSRYAAAAQRLQEEKQSLTENK